MEGDARAEGRAASRSVPREVCQHRGGRGHLLGHMEQEGEEEEVAEEPEPE